MAGRRHRRRNRFGTIGATVAVTKLIWDRRDRRMAEQRKVAEAELLNHERERLRREQAQWHAANQAQEEASRLPIYSEAQAREFLSNPRTQHEVSTTYESSYGWGRRSWLRVLLAVVLLLVVAGGLVWVILN